MGDPTPEDRDIPRELRRWQVRTVVTVFATYATYYFCRQNIAAALPAMQRDLGLTKSDLGQVTMALFIGYAIGQLVFGALSDRHGPRWLLLVGMLVSAGLNVAFAFSRPMVPMSWRRATTSPSFTLTSPRWA